jgi:hypothetical protein
MTSEYDRRRAALINDIVNRRLTPEQIERERRALLELRERERDEARRARASATTLRRHIDEYEDFVRLSHRYIELNESIRRKLRDDCGDNREAWEAARNVDYVHAKDEVDAELLRCRNTPNIVVEQCIERLGSLMRTYERRQVELFARLEAICAKPPSCPRVAPSSEQQREVARESNRSIGRAVTATSSALSAVLSGVARSFVGDLSSIVSSGAPEPRDDVDEDERQRAIVFNDFRQLHVSYGADPNRFDEGDLPTLAASQRAFAQLGAPPVRAPLAIDAAPEERDQVESIAERMRAVVIDERASDETIGESVERAQEEFVVLRSGRRVPRRAN